MTKLLSQNDDEVKEKNCSLSIWCGNILNTLLACDRNAKEKQCMWMNGGKNSNLENSHIEKAHILFRYYSRQCK